MALALVFNPGSASLKFEIIDADPSQRHAHEGKKLLSGSIEEIGKSPQMLLFAGREISQRRSFPCSDIGDACEKVISWLQNDTSIEHPKLSDLNLVCIRVVHGAGHYDKAVRYDESVRHSIEQLQELAPLHNRNALAVIDSVRRNLGPSLPIGIAFDTAFHRTMPEYARLYGIPYELTQKHNIQRFGFHGLSHRYMAERYAQLTGRTLAKVSLVTLHLESGCSATAIKDGQSIDNTMGLTPLEGLMMGTRCGDVDPALIPWLMQKEELDNQRLLHLLNKESGLIGVSGISLDTRILMKEFSSHPRAQLAMEMFCYRVKKAVGALLAALGTADAIVFGGGIGEDTPFVRQQVCEGLSYCGVELDLHKNNGHTQGEAKLSRTTSSLEVWVVAVEEGLQVAHECMKEIML